MSEKILVTRSSMPSFEEYTEMIRPIWESHWLTNMGTYHRQLEEELKEYLQVPYLSLMVNGHLSLEMAIQAMGFPEGAEVITTPFTFISTTHAIWRNGLKPVFCDVHPEDGTIDETKIEELITEHTVAIVPVHVYGHICNAEAIDEIARKYNLKVIYDAAHAFGETYKGQGVGNLGHASIYSFHATKVFNTIEGGAVTFSNPELYEKLYNLKNFGIRGEELVVEVGANAKMNEFCAAMGLCNLKHISDAIADRKRVYDLYEERLADVQGIELLKGTKEATNNYAYFPIVVKEDYSLSRDDLYDKLKSKDIFSRKYFYPTTADQACFRNRYRNAEIPNARKLSSEILVLPIYEGLSDESVIRITELMK